MTEHIELALPGEPESLSLVRVNTGILASRRDVSIEELEDLQLAVDELCLSLLGRPHARGARLLVRIDWSDERLEVRCRLEDAGDGPLVEPATAEGLPASLSGQILAALVDEHEITEEEGVPVAWFRKRWERTAPPR
jgi:hypothetical protein